MKRLLIPTLLSILLLTLLVGSLSIIISITTTPYIYDDMASIPHTQTALILGSSVSDEGKLSPVLKDRANAAIILYNAGKVKTILISGDNSTTTYNEVNPVKTYLITQGIPEITIFLDYAGFDTYSSMYRARDIFLVGSTTIVSQSFHLPRAVYIAQNLGITAYGFNADDGHYLLRNYLRELFANVKAIGNLTFHTRPKYLGEIVPLTKK